MSQSNRLDKSFARGNHVVSRLSVGRLDLRESCSRIADGHLVGVLDLLTPAPYRDERALSAGRAGISDVPLNLKLLQVEVGLRGQRVNRGALDELSPPLNLPVEPKGLDALDSAGHVSNPRCRL